MDYLLAALGLTILVLAGDALVRGAVNLALRLGIPALIVSLTIVAFGTSAPELIVVVDGVLRGAPGLALGNIVGSNTANVLLVLGLPALIFGIGASNSDTRTSYATMLAGSVLFIALAFFGPFTWVHGLILLAAFAAIQAQQLHAARAQRRAARADELEGADPAMRGWRIAAYLAAGLVGLPLGADLLVNSAVNIATRLGVSETVIGLTLVAVGTSLPELATTVVAAFRRHAEVALGNVIGSNLFNLVFIMGVAGFFGTIPVDAAFLRFDLWVMLAATLLLAPFALTGRAMGRWVGLGLTAGYAAYVLAILT